MAENRDEKLGTCVGHCDEKSNRNLMKSEGIFVFFRFVSIVAGKYFCISPAPNNGRNVPAGF